MEGPESNAARTVLTFVDKPDWKDEMPRLLAGLLALQQRGAWQTTTSNLLGSFAVERFSRTFESVPVTGKTKLEFGPSTSTVAWGQPAAASTAASAASAALAPSSASAARRAATAATKTADTRAQLLAWPPQARTAPVPLTLTQEGTGKPWATIESLAAVDLKAPFAAGYRIAKTVTPVDPAVKGVNTRGDIVRVHLDIDAQTDMTWVVVDDPVPAGATILGSGLGRDSEVATAGEKSQGGAWPDFVERGFEGYRAYYSYVPKGKFSIEYTVRLNNVGTFGLPPTRVEALYAPSTFGVLPNAPVVVQPAAPAK